MLSGGKNVIPHGIRQVAQSAIEFSSRIVPACHFDSQAEVSEVLEECYTPQNITVLGNTGAGKSSILEALAGERFCSYVNQPATLVRWQYHPHLAPHTHEWVLDRFYPADVLLNLEFWDTIGLEQEDAPQKLAHIVPKSDAILIAVSAMEPLPDKLWSYLQDLPQSLYDRMVLVLTHVERLAYEQIQQLQHELQNASQEYLSINLPVFPVITGGAHRGKHVPALAEYVQQILQKSPLTLDRIRRLLQSTGKLLQEQYAELRRQESLSQIDAKFLIQISRDIDRLQFKLIQTFPELLESHVHSFQQLLPRLGKKSARQLGSYLSIKRVIVLPKLVPIITFWFQRLIQQGVEDKQRYYNKNVINQCKQHWESVRPQIKEQYDSDIGDFNADYLLNELSVYQKRLGGMIHTMSSDLQLTGKLRAAMKQTSKKIQHYLIGIFCTIILAGILGGLGESSLGMYALGIAACLWLAGNVALTWTRTKLAKSVLTENGALPDTLKQSLQEPLFEAMSSCFVHYRALYAPIQRQVAEGAVYLQPLLDRHATLRNKWNRLKMNTRF